MDLTDTAGFGQQTGGNSSVGCQRREMTIVGEEGKGWGECVSGGSEGKVFPELGK